MRFVLILCIFTQTTIMGVLKDHGCHPHGAHKYRQKSIQIKSNHTMTEKTCAQKSTPQSIAQGIMPLALLVHILGQSRAENLNTAF